jgi:NTP pyrophosphatase (non-canonical NTP hydrolase)
MIFQFTALDPELAETLVILQEECGEVVQAVSKIFRFGVGDRTNREDFVAELGDLMAMIDLLMDLKFVSEDELAMAIIQKKRRLAAWSNLPRGSNS